MSGKAYTMKEMKAIVDYLTERRAYGEIKGRKMWVDFEKSKFTDRTWQSLKETFLKRILPDIHNPYYQLSLVQISSFRQGYDVEAKLNNKLEVKPVSEGSSTDAVQPENTEQPSTSNNKDGEKKSGEETINSKTVSHHRASAETIVLDPCYETVEDIQKDLESPRQSTEVKEKDTEKSPAKTLRDFITYSEPLTPMLQEVIDDFATDEERDPSDDEPQMEIAEDVENDKDPKNSHNQIYDETVEISSGTDDVSNSNTDMGKKCDNSQDEKVKTNENYKLSQDINISADNPRTTSAQNIIAVDVSENVVENSKSNVEDEKKENNDLSEIPLPQNNTENTSTTGTENVPQQINSTNVEKLTFSQNTPMENFSNTTSDTLIPNNQEALSTKTKPSDKDPNKDIPSKDDSKNPKIFARKRANSQEPTASKQKRRSLTLSSKTISISDTDASDKRGNKLKTNTKMDNIKETNFEIFEKENKYENLKKQNVVELEEVSKEVTNDNVEEVTIEKTNNQDNDDELVVGKAKNGEESLVENPCLKSVSLYDEQFTNIKYSESSDDVVKKTRRQKKTSIQRSKKQDLSENEIVLMKSNSEEEVRQAAKKKTTPARNVRSERDQALANVFGFSGGAVTSSRKRRVSYQNRTRRQSHNKASSGSSEWTSESDAEFVSPPRGRRNRHARKYLKPKPARILSLEEEGGLFVMYGKKIYPIVKDGKIMKNVTYGPDRDSEDEEESFWKLKYIEEKKRTAQLTKLLHQSSKGDQHFIEGSASIDQNSSPKKRNIMKSETEVQDKNTVQEVASKGTLEQPKNVPHEVKTLKIKITKQNEEVQLEGHWSQIHPVLDQVVQIFHKESEPKSYATPNTSMEQRKTSSSRTSTPVVAVVDQEAHEKVNRIETEIFKEIEALDKGAVPSTPHPTPQKEPEVAKRRGRPRKSATPSESVPEVPEKKPKKMEPEKLPTQEITEKQAPTEIENVTSLTTRKTRTPKKVLRENTERNESNVPNTRTKRMKELPSVQPIDDETDVRYKFPSPPLSGKKTSRRSGANKSMKEQKTKNRYVKKRIAIFSPLDNVSINSIESSQGYQDSDVSSTLSLRKKKKCTATYQARGKFKNRLNARRKTFWQLDNSDQSSSSCPDYIRNSKSKSISTIYRSESYQLLVPKNRNNFNNLERIDEVNLNEQNDELMSQNSNNRINRKINFNSYTSNLYNDILKVGDVTDVEYSSNVSLPTSPILSIVENISISNNELNCVRGDIADKENAHNLNEAGNNSDLKITDVDVTMSLVEQDCGFQSNIQNVTEQRYDVNDLPTIMTDSFINKICTVNIQDNPTLSETINKKLRNLLLESAKKIKASSNDRMEIDGAQTERDNQAKPKKRCSTPLKRRNTRKKSKLPEIEPSIEEEHTESYTKRGRRSCPPLIKITNNSLDIVERENVIGNTTNNKKGKKKKENVIKVKILRPKTRSCSRETNIENTAQRGESLHGDSGINDTLSSVLLQGLDESVDLIHNHSETCLQANDCLGDSVEFIENGTKSVISLDTNSDQSIEMERDFRINGDVEQNTQTELFKTINHSETAVRNALEKLRTNNIGNNEGTTYHTPLNSVHSVSSIMTEDLSDQEQEVNDRTRPSKWYLLSEDETNTNFAFPTANNNVSFGADLNKIFPISCAIPDLSTITETSNDKALGARASRNDSSSQSITDNNIDGNS